MAMALALAMAMAERIKRILVESSVGKPAGDPSRGFGSAVPSGDAGPLPRRSFSHRCFGVVMEGILERVRQVVTVEEIEREQAECRATITRLKEQCDLLDHLRNTLSKSSRDLAPGAVPQRIVRSEYEEITAPKCESSSTINDPPASAPPMLVASNKADRRDRMTGYTPNMCAASKTATTCERSNSCGRSTLLPRWKGIPCLFSHASPARRSFSETRSH